MTPRAPRRLSPLTPVVRGFIVLVAAGTTVVRDVTRGDLGPTATVLGLVLLGGAVYGAASWLRTTFWIESDELRVDTGVLQRQSRRIRIDRLQGVDIVQPFVARLFGLAELRMDVAGGSAREGSLAYLPLAEARRLKDLLLTRRAELGPVRAPADQGPPAHTPGEGGAASATPLATVATPTLPDRVLARVDLPTLVLSILLSGNTVAVLFAALAMLGVFVARGAWLGAGAVLPLVAAILLAQFREFAAGYGFTVTETPAGLQVRRGLFDLSAQTIALHRVQGVVLHEPALWRRIGWARLEVSIAGYASGEAQGPSASSVLPVGRRDLVLALARHVLGGGDLERVHLRKVPPRARWASPLAHRFLGVGNDERLVVSREGWFVRRTHVAPQARIQSVRLTQGPWQRLLGLADVHLDSPSGPAHVRARHRDAAQARRLFAVEVAMTAWARRNLPGHAR